MRGRSDTELDAEFVGLINTVEHKLFTGENERNQLQNVIFFPAM